MSRNPVDGNTTENVQSLRNDKTVADELFVEGRESNNGPLRLKTYLGARNLNSIRLSDPPWSLAQTEAQADPTDLLRFV